MSWATLGNPDFRSFTDINKRTGALRENYSRKGLTTADIANWIVTTKQSMTSILLQAGEVVTSATFFAGATVHGTPVNSWMSLYDGSRNLCRQSTDTLTSVWGSSAEKTLTLDSIPVTAGARVASVVVTLTFPTLNQALPSLIAVGDSVVVSNANIAAYNGTFTVTGVTATTITYNSGGSATDSLASPFPTVQLAAGKRTYVVPTSGLYYVGVMQVATTCSSFLAVNILAGMNSLAPIPSGRDNTTVCAGTGPSPAVALSGLGSDAWCYLS